MQEESKDDNKRLSVEEKRARIQKEISEKVVEPSNYAVQHISDLYKKKLPEVTWLVDRLVPTEAVTIFSASPGSYKTRSMLHLAKCVSKGEPLFGEFATIKAGVLIIDEESGERLLQKQLKQLGAADDSEIYYRSFQNFKLSKENIDLIKQDCRTYDIKVVIFDSLIQIHNANENEATEMAPVMNYLKQLAEEAGITVIVIAHDRKTGQFGRKGNSELRGSSAILAGVDTHISMLKRKDRLIIEPTKLRHAQLHEPFEVLVTGDDDFCNFEFQGLSKPADNTALKAAIIDLVQENEGLLSQKDLLSRLKDSGTRVSESNLRKVLKEMLEDNDIDYMPGKGKTKLYILPAN